MKLSSGPKSSENKLKLEVITHIGELVEELESDPFLNKVAEDQLTEEQWREFIMQRCLCAEEFRVLLERGIKISIEELRSENIKRTLLKILRDQLGKVSKKQSRRVYSSRMLIGIQKAPMRENRQLRNREEFMYEIGISRAYYYSARNGGTTKATSDYKNAVYNIMNNGTPLETIGAILAIEQSVPFEFKLIQKGRNQRFPNMSDKGKEYIDSHVAQNSQDHHPELLEDIFSYISFFGAPEDIEDIKTGISKIKNAKKEFYLEMLDMLPIDFEVADTLDNTGARALAAMMKNHKLGNS